MQLRRIVTEFPKADPTSYAFGYKDTATLEEEIDEWFSYNEAEFKRLNRARDTFERRWRKFAGKNWLDADVEERARFVQREATGLLATDLRRRCKSLQTLLHIILGVWDETAGLKVEVPEVKGKGKGKEKEKAVKDAETNRDTREGAKESNNKTKATEPQLEHMKAGIHLISEAGGLPLIFQVLQDALKRLWWVLPCPKMYSANMSRDDDFRESHLLEEDISFIQDELDNVTTLMYLVIEGVRNDETLTSPRDKLRKLGEAVTKSGH